MTSRVSLTSLFDKEDFLFLELKKPILQVLREMRDYSNLHLKATEVSADLVRATLNHSRAVLSSLTLEGSWEDKDFKTFTPFMDNVVSLHLLNPSFTDAAFDEAFMSEVSHENPFEETLDTYCETEDEWDRVPVILPPRLPYITETSFEESDDHLFSGWVPSSYIDNTPPSKVLNRSCSTVCCKKLTHLIIENPPLLSKDFFLKLLPLKDQLTSLTLINFPAPPSSKDILTQFPNLQELVIKRAVE